MTVTEIEPEAFAALQLEGRAFRSREGKSRFRGRVRRTAFEEGMICVEVTNGERRRAPDDWAPHKDFTYQGNPMVTSIFQEGDGGLHIVITYIGELWILPEGAP